MLYESIAELYYWIRDTEAIGLDEATFFRHSYHLLTYCGGWRQIVQESDKKTAVPYTSAFILLPEMVLSYTKCSKYPSGYTQYGPDQAKKLGGDMKSKRIALEKLQKKPHNFVGKECFFDPSKLFWEAGCKMGDECGQHLLRQTNWGGQWGMGTGEKLLAWIDCEEDSRSEA